MWHNKYNFADFFRCDTQCTACDVCACRKAKNCWFVKSHCIDKCKQVFGVVLYAAFWAVAFAAAVVTAVICDYIKVFSQFFCPAVANPEAKTVGLDDAAVHKNDRWIFDITKSFYIKFCIIDFKSKQKSTPPSYLNIPKSQISSDLIVYQSDTKFKFIVFMKKINLDYDLLIVFIIMLHISLRALYKILYIFY